MDEIEKETAHILKYRLGMPELDTNDVKALADLCADELLRSWPQKSIRDILRDEILGRAYEEAYSSSSGT